MMETFNVPAPTQAEAQKRIEDQRHFVERLVRRQGTSMPDFRSLYEKKAKLDGAIWPYKKP
jgi:hypothetical protein